MLPTEFKVLDKENFDSFVAENEGIIIFHKKLCPHCKIMGTVLTKVQSRIPGFALAAVDSEEQTELMEKAGVTLVPTLVAVKEGKLAGWQVGVRNPNETIAFFQDA